MRFVMVSFSKPRLPQILLLCSDGVWEFVAPLEAGGADGAQTCLSRECGCRLATATTQDMPRLHSGRCVWVLAVAGIAPPLMV